MANYRCSSDGSATEPVWQTWTSNSTATNSAASTWNTWTTSAETNWVETTWNHGPQQVRQRRPPVNSAEYERAIRRVFGPPRDPQEEAEAERKAQELLLRNLDARQAAQYRKEKRFRVRAESGTVYEIDCTKRMHNVYQLERGRRTHELCAYAGSERLPLADNHLAQKLLIEHQEARFREVANITPLAA